MLRIAEVETMTHRWIAPFLAASMLLATGCSMPCSKVREEVEARYGKLSKELRQGRDPGGELYDLTLVLPGPLLDSSFQRMLDEGTVKKTHKTQVDIPLPNVPSDWSVRFRADLQDASFAPIASPRGARVQAHAVLRLRGTSAGSELFDITANVDGPVEVFTQNSRDAEPELYLRIGDLEQSEVAIDGSILGQAVRTQLEGLIPRGALGSILDSIGIGDDVIAPLEEAFEREVRKHATTLAQSLLAETVGDVKVMDVGAIQMGDLEFVPTGVGLRTGDGWVGLGLRTDLATGGGELPIEAPNGPKMGRMQLRVSGPFLQRAVELAYVEGVIPRAFDDDGSPCDEGPYWIELLGIELDESPRVGLRLSRCEEPCGWAELWGDMTLDASDREELAIHVDAIEVQRSKGSGKLVELALWHQQKVVGEPVEFVQQVSRVLRPGIGGRPLTLRINRISTTDGHLTLNLSYQLPGAEGGRSPEGSRKGGGRKKPSR